VQPQIYPLTHHQIPAGKIDRQAYYIIQKLRQAGHVAYLVGGSVRDLLLNIRPKDFDISTSAKPEEIKKLFKNCILIGKRFRLAHIRFGRKILEVSTFRAGDMQSNELILRDNEWGTEEEDVLRRDFTINGLYYDPESQTIIDYVGGFEDIDKKILKAIGIPELRFAQDPVRMIRLIKFKARLKFHIDPSTHEALLNSKELIVKSSQARIMEELLRMLESSASKDFFRLLNEYGLLHSLLPLLSEALTKEENNPILHFLDHVDQFHKKNHLDKLARPLLLGCLLFPLLQERLKTRFEMDKKIHLGHIAEQARQLVNEFFSSFFQISRKTKAELISLLTHQYRFIPLFSTENISNVRIPKDPRFFLSLMFLKIRSEINQDFKHIYSQWEKHYELRKKQKPNQKPHYGRRKTD